jgi:hypothetical protein
MLFARIQDLSGPFDGLNGVVVDVWEAEGREELEARVGAEAAREFVEAPHAACRGWRYEAGVLVGSANSGVSGSD